MSLSQSMKVDIKRKITQNMKNIIRLMVAALLLVSVVTPGKAEERKDKNGGSKSYRSMKQTTAGCSPSSAFEWLNINNVRTRINAGGDMWWDLPSGTGAKYYVPASGSATSLFAGSLWIAGLDINNQLKCAAVRFRQDGNDFWTGPLSVDNASIDDVTCAQWDKIFNITRAQVDEFLSHCDETGKFVPAEGYEVPKVIAEWPAHGDLSKNQSKYLAPFFDRDGDGLYDYAAGDYPYYDIDNELCHTKVPTMDETEGYVNGSILADQVLKGDQTLWWVFNDKGNSHTESQGAAIGLEIRGQAFAFATNDEINNMTFCSYEIINRSTYELTGTYFSPWTDVDLGYGWDDFVGCDVSRGLGFGYNGKAIDGSGEPESYGDQPPAIGVDFFQGPYMDPDGLDNPKYSFTVNTVGDSINGYTYDTVGQTQLCDESINGVNFGNGIVDDERFGMRRFVYHDNGTGNNCDPDDAAETYLMLRGIWKDGNKMQYGGNAYSGSDVVGPACDFMFPGDTDPCNWGTGGVVPNGGYTQNGKYWTEEQCGNTPNDRRFMQSAGPFTLKAGAVNYITFGVPWARATSGGPWASVELLRTVDDKCQALFDNCFKVIDGPNAPDLTIRELDQQLIVYLSNTTTSNNYKEGYTEFDPEIPEIMPDDTTQTIPADRYYRFEGYKVYQLINDQVGADELSDNSKARLVFQCDIKNNISRIVNFEYDDYVQANVPSLKVDGADGGITHSFVLTEDKFATGDNNTLVNHKTYYFMAVAYSYNNYMTYSQEPGNMYGLYGQMEPYLEGRKNIKCYSAIPHKIVNGTVLRSDYGDRPAITRIVGIGNGGNELELSDETVNEILSKRLANEDSTVVFGSPDYPIAYHPKYKVGYGPVDVKIIDPLNVVTTDYELWFDSLVEKYTQNVTNDGSIKGDSAARMVSHWFLKDMNTGDVYKSDTTTIYKDEKMFIDRGISISITQPYDIGPVKVGQIWQASGGTGEWRTAYSVLSPDNGMITSSIQFQDSTNQWLDGIRDKDIPGSVLNWIRSGTYVDQDDKTNSDFNMAANKPFDPTENYEKIANRTWAPYNLCSFTKQGFPTNPGPVASPNSRYEDYFPRVASVDIVFTSDRSKWTRCPVVEMCMDDKLSQGNAKRFFLRKSPSIDKDGNFYEGDWTNDSVPASTNPEDPNYISNQGMGWFPGYVIDVETGARLNVAYGEDSYLEDFNGRDMQFNPPALLKATVDELYGDYSQLYDPSLFRQIDNDPVMGGKHFVYIFGMDKPTDIPGNIPYTNFNSPAYDGGKYLVEAMKFFQSSNYGPTMNVLLWRQVMWTGMPMAVEGKQWLQEGNDARVRIRVAKPYAPGYAICSLDSLYSELDINNLNPKYQFSIEGLNPIHNDETKTSSDLDLVTVVPNPYYAHSYYEANSLTNAVKITNLPNNCLVTIYTINGTKVRQFKKDNEEASIEWDLTNFASTPVASGFYLIHIKDYTSGEERVIKFFGAMRQVDLNTF
jgi:hypothetical protein